MKIQLLSRGFAHLQDYVLPYIASVRKHEPDANLCIVDNGSPEPYPQFDEAESFRTDNLAIMSSFNRAIYAHPGCDWYVLSDTDILCTGKFLDTVSGWDKHSIYGMQRFQQGSVEWFDGWLFGISSEALEKIGYFDEYFMVTGAFQDLDYCIRARSAGFTLRDASLPFIHLEANTTHKSPNFWQNREINRRLIQTKHNFTLVNR